LTLRQAVKGATVSLSVDGKKFKAHVPAGVKDGQKIKLAGKGKPGINGGKAGDLYLHVTVNPDSTFSMRGRDIVMNLPVTVGQAVAGGKVDAKDIDGNLVTFKVPAGSSSGAEVKLAGLGVKRGNQPGDLIGRVQIMVPAKPGLAVKHAAKEFDEKAGDYLN
jgi:grpE